MHTAQLNSDYQISWTVKDDNLYLKLDVKTIGWIGFGLSEPSSGSMPGADILSAHVNDDGTVEIVDRYATAKALPKPDDCGHWILGSGKEENGTTTIEVMRKLVTDDKQDRPITSGHMKIIYAYGETDSFSYHGSSRFSTSVAFIPNDNEYNPDTSGWSTFLFNSSYTVPSFTTTYACSCYELPPVEAHITKMEIFIDPATAHHVHHLVVYRCSSNDSNYFQRRKNNPDLCDSPLDTDGDSCGEVLWAWAHGISPLVLPENVGYRIGSVEGAFSYIKLQFHYDNPDRISGMVDNSGLKIYYTTELREHDAGVVQFGDPNLSSRPLPPGEEKIEHQYTCSSACTSYWPHEVTVISTFLHMHGTGSQAFSTHWRNGNNLGVVNRIEYYDYGFQSFNPVKTVIKPGDAIQTHCIWDTTTRSETTYFGEPSSDEMCIEFVLYYPRIEGLPYCGYFYYEPHARSYTMCGDTYLNELNPTFTDVTTASTGFGKIYDNVCAYESGETKNAAISMLAIIIAVTISLFL